MWTDADHRRQGLAQRVLAELETRAAALGYSKIYLTTGFRQPEAASLYLTSGSAAQFDVNADPASVQILPFTKVLAEQRNERLTA